MSETQVKGAAKVVMQIELRDLFAAFAMQAIIGNRCWDCTHSPSDAYVVADAMLAARERKGGA